MWKWSRRHSICSSFKFWPVQPPKGAIHSCRTSFLLEERGRKKKKKPLLNSLGPENNMALMEGDVGGRTADAHPSSGKRRHLKPHGTGSTWLIRGTTSSSAWLEHPSMKSRKNHWKGRLGSWFKQGTARHSTGYIPKTKLLPLRSLQL